MIANNSNSLNQNGFTIGVYRDNGTLELSPNKDGKYKCPNCQEYKLSIRKDGVKYNCYGCRDTIAIAKILSASNNNHKEVNNYTEYNNKVISTKSQVSQKKKVSKEAGQELTILTKIHEVLPACKSLFDNKLAFNVRTDKIELDGAILSIDMVRAWLHEEYKLSINSKDMLTECLLYLARKNEYDPVKQMLQECLNQYDPDVYPIDIKAICGILFGVTDDLSVEYLKRWLIGIAARVFKPGCKFDEALILKGMPAIYKSTFFKVLAGEFFTDSMGEIKGKDSLDLLKRYWLVEWSELDSMTAKTYHGVIKTFLSRSDDAYRKPYGRDTENYPRRSVIVGSTNRDDFLTDPTGNRRFWIIDIPDGHIIPLESLEAMRTNLLGWGAWQYQLGERWYLSREMMQLQADHSKQYLRHDPWIDLLSGFLDTQEMITTRELLLRLHDQDYGIRFTVSESMRMGDMLRALGWTRKRLRVNGKPTWVYCNPSFESGLQ